MLPAACIALLLIVPCWGHWLQPSCQFSVGLAQFDLSGLKSTLYTLGNDELFNLSFCGTPACPSAGVGPSPGCRHLGTRQMPVGNYDHVHATSLLPTDVVDVNSKLRADEKLISLGSTGLKLAYSQAGAEPRFAKPQPTAASLTVLVICNRGLEVRPVGFAPGMAYETGSGSPLFVLEAPAGCPAAATVSEDRFEEDGAPTAALEIAAHPEDASMLARWHCVGCAILDFVRYVSNHW
eukprot:TRINITY_DN22050_c0_g1_i2.p1 TRINITY_DN22050_c0_g1~~TRINITY_DN22050_c0_g1_i2.p1  ORF type:complete len:237 (+),score=29.37 TRINITY_DN22050_c0_g1_i2:112-822(+)